MKYYEILPTHTETPRNTTRKIANLYIEFNYHFLTLQKKSHYFFNRSEQTRALVESRSRRKYDTVVNHNEVKSLTGFILVVSWAFIHIIISGFTIICMSDMFLRAMILNIT